MKCLVTGGAGFIGSTLVDELVQRNNEVLVLDNFRTGNRNFLKNFKGKVINTDLLDPNRPWASEFKDIDVVYHLAANADVKDGWKHIRFDLEQNLHSTLATLEVAVENNVKEFIFSSTGSVYGKASKFPTPEDAPFPVQTSLYGASKNAAESYISAYAEAGLIKATVFRFVSVLGERYTHGHVIDFVRQLLIDPKLLKVLGDGHQTKSYMHVTDCVRGVIDLRTDKKFDVFNLGNPEYCNVKESISWILDEMQLHPEIMFSGGSEGWIGDNPIIWLDVKKAYENGWEPKFNIEQSIRNTVRWLLENRNYI